MAYDSVALEAQTRLIDAVQNIDADAAQKAVKLGASISQRYKITRVLGASDLFEPNEDGKTLFEYVFSELLNSSVEEYIKIHKNSSNGAEEMCDQFDLAIVLLPNDAVYRGALWDEYIKVNMHPNADESIKDIEFDLIDRFSTAEQLGLFYGRNNLEAISSILEEVADLKTQPYRILQSKRFVPVSNTDEKSTDGKPLIEYSCDFIRTKIKAIQDVNDIDDDFISDIENDFAIALELAFTPKHFTVLTAFLKQLLAYRSPYTTHLETIEKELTSTIEQNFGTSAPHSASDALPTGASPEVLLQLIDDIQEYLISCVEENHYAIQFNMRANTSKIESFKTFIGSSEVRAKLFAYCFHFMLQHHLLNRIYPVRLCISGSYMDDTFNQNPSIDEQIKQLGTTFFSDYPIVSAYFNSDTTTHTSFSRDLIYELRDSFIKYFNNDLTAIQSFVAQGKSRLKLPDLPFPQVRLLHHTISCLELICIYN